MVCDSCYRGNWDGWAPQLESSITSKLNEQRLPLPERNANGLLPREQRMRIPSLVLTCRQRIAIALAGACLSIASASCVAQFADAPTRRFQGESYTLEYPSTWAHKVQKAPDGTELQMFMGPEAQKAMPYCHTTQQPLNPSLAPRLAKMNEKQRREFFLATSNQELLFSLCDSYACDETLEIGEVARERFV